MTRGERIVLGVLVVWALGWLGGAWGFLHAAQSQREEDARLSLPLTGLVPGGDVRLEGVIGAGRGVTGPLTGRQCAAAVAELSRRTSYYDAHHKTQYDTVLVARRAVPDDIEIRAGEQSAALAIDLWKPPAAHSADTSRVSSELPAQLQVTDAELARAVAKGRGDFWQFIAEEWTLEEGQRVFVAAHLQETGGRLRLTADSELGKVVLFRGSRDEAVAAGQSTSTGLRIAGFVFIALAVVPLLGWGARRHLRAA